MTLFIHVHIIRFGVVSPHAGDHAEPSVAVSRGGAVRVAWWAKRESTLLIDFASIVLWDDFAFDLFDIDPRYAAIGNEDHWPSAGASDAEVAATTWTRRIPVTAQPRGLIWTFDDYTSAELIRACPDPMYGYRVWQWQPCVAMDSAGNFAVVWQDAEDEYDTNPPFNVVLQMFDSTGSAVGGEVIVNQSVSAGLTSEESTAVALDDDGNIVIVWVGRQPDDCDPRFRIYTRRLAWDGLTTPTVAGDQFIVDQDEDWKPISAADANPTVALTLDTVDPGAFVVAWNVTVIEGIGGQNIHAQYFHSDGEPRGREFRINQAIEEETPFKNRRLANSGQHTLVYGADDQVIATWTRYDDVEEEDGTAIFTILPAGHAETTCAGLACLKGDCNDDDLVNGLDIQPFVDVMLGEVPEMCDFEVFFDICPYDINEDCLVDMADVPPFVGLLLDVSKDRLLDDCNDNGIPDANDIAYGTSEDCNKNYIPDECDIDPTDPDGDGEISNDLNANTIPDECEPDCNENGVPDDKDIADETSTDVNSNGIPDECDPDCNDNDVPDDWDILQETSADCNENGTPDECKPDCNHNDVPDDCDLDPSDPDGDEFVSEDCNENNYPDECDLTLPPGFGSLDCNDNDIPDECDLAACEGEAWCDDCNENGFLDVCDIAAEISDDENENGIPDECEGEGPLGGGEGGGGGAPMGAPFGDPTPGPVGGVPDAWAAFFDWSMDQSWGPDAEISGAAQFQMMINKLDELGLPMADPWYLRDV